jgi:hypothetical protein
MPRVPPVQRAVVATAYPWEDLNLRPSGYENHSGCLWGFEQSSRVPLIRRFTWDDDAPTSAGQEEAF